MIYLVCSRGEEETIGKFIRGTRRLRSTLRTVTYDTLLSRRSAPIAHYIFTDHDRLDPVTLERAAHFAEGARAADSAVQILNHPLGVRERYGLIRRLSSMGIGGFDMVRLDEERLPRFPAFIRQEAGTGLPESGLLQNEADYRAALAVLASEGKTRKGRVAVEYMDTRSPDGRFRKYGAIRIGDRIVPQHLLISDDWVVKMGVARIDAATAAEELAFVTGELPVAELTRAFDAGGIQYGRMDYALVNGCPKVFEINTNPSLPRPGGGDTRGARRDHVCGLLTSAFVALDRPLSHRGTFRVPRAARPPALSARVAHWLKVRVIRSHIGSAYLRRRRNRRNPPVPPSTIA